MPIKPEMRGFYPSDWPQISRRVRFERAAGICQGCGRPHGTKIRCLPDGRWFDPTQGIWRNGRGRSARWPDLVETAQVRHTRVVLAAAHLDHNPRTARNLKSLCQRCHMIHDRPHHLAQRRITYLLRRALGDLFLGPYSICLGLQKPDYRWAGQPSSANRNAFTLSTGRERNQSYFAKQIRPSSQYDAIPAA